MPISEANLINLYQNLRQNRFAQLIFDVKNALFQKKSSLTGLFCAQTHTYTGKVPCWGKFGGKIARYRFLLLHFLVK